MALSLEQLKSAFKKNETEGSSRPNNYYPFWNIPEGSQAIIRFLPDANAENPMGFMVEKLMHTLTINGENKSTPCLKLYDEECPVCKVSSAYYKEEDKINGKKYWRKKQHIAQVLVVEDPLAPNDDTGETHVGKVRFVALGFQLFNIIKSAFEDGELEEVPFAFKGGSNFIIKKTKQGDYPSYSLSKFARRSSDLTDEEIAEVTEQMIDLHTLLPQSPGLDKTEAMLEAALTGADFEDGKSSSGSTTDFTKVNKKSEKTTENEEDDAGDDSKTEAGTTTANDDEGFDDEADQILQQIRARQKSKAE